MKSMVADLQNKCQELQAENENLKKERKIIEQKAIGMEELISQLQFEITQRERKIHELMTPTAPRVFSSFPNGHAQNCPTQSFNPFDE